MRSMALIGSTVISIKFVTEPAKMDQVGTQNLTTFFKFVASYLMICSGY